MRARILAASLALGAMGLLASCDLENTLNETFNVFKVKFSSADPAYAGPTVGGPSWANSLVQLALPVSMGGSTAQQIMGQYHLDLTFRVQADNSGNTQRASFGQTVRPVLNLRINDKASADPISTEMAPFSIEGGQRGFLEFPVQIPLTKIDQTTLKAILNGTDIPYFLSGTLNFELLEGLQVKGSGQSEIDLATGAIPTRSTGDLDLASMSKYLTR